MSWISMLLTDVTRSYELSIQSSSFPGLSCDPKHPGGRAKLSHSFSGFNALVLSLSLWDLHLDFSFFAYTQSCRTLVQVLIIDAPA